MSREWHQQPRRHQRCRLDQRFADSQPWRVGVSAGWKRASTVPEHEYLKPCRAAQPGRSRASRCRCRRLPDASARGVRPGQLGPSGPPGCLWRVCAPVRLGLSPRKPDASPAQLASPSCFRCSPVRKRGASANESECLRAIPSNSANTYLSEIGYAIPLMAATAMWGTVAEPVCRVVS